MKRFITVPARLTAVSFLLMLATSMARGQTTTTPLSMALNTTTTSLAWTSYGNYGGDNPWFAQSDFSHDSALSAQSGPDARGEYGASILETTVSGPVTVSFWWNVNTATQDGQDRYSQRGLSFGIDNTIGDTLAYTVGDSDYEQADWSHCVYAIPPGQHTLRWNYSASDGTGCGWLDQVAISAGLPQALNCPALPWVTGEDGSATWSAEPAVTQDNTFAAYSGVTADNDSSTLKAALAGSGTLSFWWKVSSEEGYDSLRFTIDGVEQAGAISGEVDWQYCTYQIPAGQHEIKWSYTKDGSDSAGSDCGWVDAVSWDVPWGRALNNCVLPWVTPAVEGYPLTWFSQSEVTHDGSCAIQAGLLNGDIQTTVNGPGPLTFWWKNSAGLNPSYLSFSSDFASDSISGETDWQQKSYQVPAGQHLLTWSYVHPPNDYGNDPFDGTDRAWLDQVVFGPPTPPASPIAIAISANQICLDWTAAANNASYRIERSPNGAAPWTVVTSSTLSAEANTYVDSGLSEGTKYYYRIYATNEGSDSSPATVNCTSLPNPPDSLMVNDLSTSQTARVRISWTDRSTKESGFLLERSPNGTDSWTAILVGPSSGTDQSVTCEDSDGLTMETHYWYRVRATMTGQ